jgi:peroxiredoxin
MQRSLAYQPQPLLAASIQVRVLRGATDWTTVAARAQFKPIPMSDARRYLAFELLNPKGKPISLREVLGKRPTVACFVRHFGCLFCFEHVADAIAQNEAIKQRGAQLIIVGNGNPSHAREFERDVRLEGQVYTDPSRQLYRALAMRHGIGRTINLQVSRNARRAFQAGFRQIAVKGDRWQQGGNVVFGADGAILFSQYAEVAGDPLPVAEAVRALR